MNALTLPAAVIFTVRRPRPHSSVDGLQVDDERRNRLAETKYVRSVVKRGVEREKLDLGVGLSGRLVAWHRVPNLSFTYPTNPKYGPDLINV